MASLLKILAIRQALYDLEGYAHACKERLEKQHDASRDWILSRPPAFDVLVDRLRKACEAACEETKTT